MSGTFGTGVHQRVDTEASLHRYKVVRGALDFGGVVGRTQSRSKYGGIYVDIRVTFETHVYHSQETEKVVPMYLVLCPSSYLYRNIFLHSKAEQPVFGMLADSHTATGTDQTSLVNNISECLHDQGCVRF